MPCCAAEWLQALTKNASRFCDAIGLHGENLQVLQLVSWVCGPWRKFDLRPDYLGVARMWKAILKLQNNLSFQITSIQFIQVLPQGQCSTLPEWNCTSGLLLSMLVFERCFEFWNGCRKRYLREHLRFHGLLSVANRGLTCSHPCRSRGGQLYPCTSTSLREIFGNTLAIAPLGVMWQWILAQLEVPTKS